MGHNHDHGDTTGRSLLISMVINFLIPVAQIVGGIYAGSMALISDAIHNLSDFTALMIAYFAHVLGKRKPTPLHTFGLVRLEIVAAAVNAALLGGTAVFIAIEAVKRLSHPSPVDTKIVAILAFVGILGNGFSALLLHENSENNLNVRGAFLHMMGDLMTSVVVLIGAAVMYFKPWSWVDPVLSLMIVVYIVINCLLLLKESVHVLMDGTPLGLDVMAIKEKIEALSGVTGIHHLHTWLIGGDVIALTCHVVVPDQPVSTTESLSHEIRETLEAGFNVTHTVFQFESKPCGHGELLCRSAVRPDHDGHECDLGFPTMPLGLKAGLAAMNVLGVERSKDKELSVIAETGKGHAAGCFLDGIMTATGSTYGKSNIDNKMAFTLIDNKTSRAVRETEDGKTVCIPCSGYEG